MKEKAEWWLVEKCKQGNVEAFNELVDRYQSVIYHCTYRILGHPEDAADVAQTAFLKLFEHLASFDSERSFFSWMYRIAVNEAIDFKRRNRRFEGIDDEVMQSPDAGPFESLEASTSDASVQACLLKLPEDGRVVIVLRHFGELSYQEISEVLELPEKTVRSRLYAARQQLKRLLMRED